MQIVDSNEYHHTIFSEIQYQANKFKNIFFNFLKSRWSLYLFIWIVLLVISMKYQCTRIFLCLSGISIIFGNLGKRAPGTLSAYSIFNKNHEKLLGTFDSAEVDKQLANRMNEIPRNNQDKSTEKLSEEDEYEIFQKIKESYEKNQSKFANQPCYCGSLKKYKKCCYWRELKQKEELELERKKKKL